MISFKTSGHRLIVLIIFVGLRTTVSAILKESVDDDHIEIDNARMRKFPDTFKLGTATSAYQIEGGWNSDGKGPSIWDTFTHQFPEKIADRSNGDVATDSYNLYKEDVAALKSINSQFYRFSFSWSRILSTGDVSSQNSAGVEYYHRLINELIENDIEPVPTMYHWDLPQYLQDLGGWTNPLIIDYFEQYANFLFQQYGSKVSRWITFNEPLEFCSKGYAYGTWPPLVKANGIGEYLCAHHVILSHARSYHLYKNRYYPTQNGRVGITLNTPNAFPNDPDNEEDRLAAARCLQFDFGLYANAIFSPTGDYPEIIRQLVDKNSIEEGRPWSRLPKFTPEMVDYVRGASDFLGLNFYTSYVVTPANPDSFPNPSKQRDSFMIPARDPKWPKALSSWLYSVPIGLYSMLLWIRDSYKNVEVFITENGWSDHGEIDDADRIKYLNEHLNAVLDAIEAGCNVTGHTAWSLIDNFEWLEGYTEKFGLFMVDIANNNFTRVEKKSARYLRKVFTSRTIETFRYI